jgi:sigma-54 dependent transcriptional regulator, acetoin dehydrogenase operon transcriptional activator AcoR
LTRRQAIASQLAALRERQRGARDRFFQGDSPLQMGIDPAVVRGWQRSMAHGIEPDRQVVFQAVHLNALRAATEAGRDLIQAATSELDQLGRTLQPSGASVLLTDASLTILAVRGRREQMSPEHRIASREGIDLSERSIGSNALTIAAFEQAPSVVVNNAHYCSVISMFSCAAAPIRSPKGALLGVIDVTTCHQPLPGQAAFLVTAAARSVENTLFALAGDQLTIRFHPRAEFVGTALEGVLAVTLEGEVCGANEAALSMLGLRWPLRGVRFERLFRETLPELLTQAGRLERFSMALTTRDGVPLTARVDMPVRAPSVRQSSKSASSGGSGVTSGITSKIAPDAALDVAPNVDLNVAPNVDPKAASPKSLSTTTQAEPGKARPDGSALAALAGEHSGLASQVQLARAALLRGVPVVIQGESGTGRHALARALVAEVGGDGAATLLQGAQADEPALEAAFSKAAAGGVLVLDEVQALAEPLQARLVRLLQQREARQSLILGSDAAAAPSGAPLRVLTLTTCDLRAACEAGRFRYDLHHRLKGLRVELPPLAQRTDRAQRIMQAFEEAEVQAGLLPHPARLDLAILEVLKAHSWPGNFRELHWLMSALVCARPAGPVLPEHLPAEILQSATLLQSATRLGARPSTNAASQAGVHPSTHPGIQPAGLDPLGAGAQALAGSRSPSLIERGRGSTASVRADGAQVADPIAPARALRDLADRAIRQAIEKHRGNLSSAARELGISRGTLYRRLRGQTSTDPQTS